jgi:glycosyltransferase involved in cell wall biosynthesis
LVSLAIVGIAVLGIQLLFFILFLVAFQRYRPLKDEAPRPVSIIVCAHDEEQNLRELVPLLLRQSHPAFEVIIVEDRCNDGTYDYLLQATKENDNLRMVRVVNKPEHVNGKKYALTLGIKAAKYDRVLLTDADCRPVSEEWATQMSNCYLSSTEFVLGFSPYAKGESLLNAFIRFESTLTGIQMVGMARLGNPYMGLGRNLLYEKKVFLENKGFNDHLEVTGGDDDLFVNRHATSANTLVRLGADCITVSKPKQTWAEFYQQKKRHLSVGKRYRFTDRLVLGLFTLSWMLIWFLVLPVAIVHPWGLWLGATFLVRWLVMGILFHQASIRLGQRFEAWKVPFLDFIYAFYYLVAGVAALKAKRIRWKN